MTRYGIDGTSAAGQVGILSLIIEDDLIAFMQGDSTEITLRFSSIMLADESLSLQPVNGDSLVLTVYNPGYLLSSQREERRQAFRCFPNPVQDGRLNLTAPYPMQEARIYNMLGREVYRLRSPGTRNWAFRLPGGWPPAYYLLPVYSEGGRVNKQLLFIP
ncbi:MAG: hypothetical protein KDD10_01395 [Phaeodactylibacter sp.]|nr:hypothetical protein [Phaeodactylibacter sp.]